MEPKHYFILSSLFIIYLISSSNVYAQFDSNEERRYFQSGLILLQEEKYDSAIIQLYQIFHPDASENQLERARNYISLCECLMARKNGNYQRSLELLGSVHNIDWTIIKLNGINSWSDLNNLLLKESSQQNRESSIDTNTSNKESAVQSNAPNIRTSYFTSFVQSFTHSRPIWTEKLPTPTNNTYVYVCEKALSHTETEARNQALSRVFQTAAMRIGVTFDAQQVFEAVQRGTDLSILSMRFKIPINKICDFTERIGDYYQVYVLCEVASTVDTKPLFDASFSHCNDLFTKSSSSSLISSIFLPGLGQMEKGHIAEGAITLSGEILLIGGAISTYFIGQKKIDKIKNGISDYSEYEKECKSYDNLHSTNQILWISSAALYLFNIIRAATIKPRYQQLVTLQPSVMNIACKPIPSFDLTFHF